MLVTIYTDAGIKSNGTATYAFRAKSKYGTISGTGNNPNNVNGSTNKAEHFAIRKAIKAVMKKWSNTTVYFINTDSLQVCKTYWKLGGLKIRGGTSKDIVDEVKRVVDYFNENNLKIRLKHVKAHTNRKDIRSYLNDWCDKYT